MKKWLTIGFLALEVFCMQLGAGEITDTYSNGDTFTATMLDNIKSAVNDNNTNTAGNTSSISTHNSNISTNASNISTNNASISNHETRISGLEAIVPGVNVAYGRNSVPLSNVATTVIQVTVNTPDSDGYVLVQYTGLSGISHTNGTRDMVRAQLMDTESAIDASAGFISTQLISALPGSVSETYYTPINCQRLFPVTRNTTYTFYVRGDLYSGASASLSHNYLTALFVSAAIGTLPGTY